MFALCRMIVASRVFEQTGEISSLMFDRDCAYLVIGFGNSTLRILDANTLQDELAEPFTFAKAPITHITFTHDNVYLATADAAHTITLYKRRGGTMWQYLCRYHTHCKPIRDLLAGVHIDTNKPRLLSVGEDRMLVEYDLENSSEDNLRILAIQRFEQSAVPLCMTWYPPVCKEQFLCTANSQFKLKLYNAVTKMCRKTALGPCYGSCVQKYVLFPFFRPQFFPFLTSSFWRLFSQNGCVEHSVGSGDSARQVLLGLHYARQSRSADFAGRRKSVSLHFGFVPPTRSCQHGQ